MIYTARQLQDLHKAAGQIVLPYGARLTPLAADWTRAKKIAVGYSNVDAPQPAAQSPALSAPIGEAAAKQPGQLLWWCDGPCGGAKAAVMAQAKESSLNPIDIPSDRARLIAVIKHLAGEVKGGRASGGALLLETGAAAVVLANRCAALRAMLGTSLRSVEDGIAQAAANVLVIEYPGKTLSQVKNLLGRFARANVTLNDSLRQTLAELTSCA
jgi:ribose 5-phosphate isomerase RpiB